jgi:hypothetical protein
MKRISFLLLFLLAISALARPTQVETNVPAVQFGIKLELHSKILNEDRPYWVYLPPSYQTGAIQSPQKYPVLYLLDGEWNFQWASEVVQFMADSLQIPELIVVGIPNLDRDKDLTPTHDTNNATSGGGPAFETFISEELAPEINARFRTVPCRILVGHSLGGALAADAFLRQTNGFRACIAIDPSLWWDHEVLVHRAAGFLPETNSRAALFIATANWPPNLDPTNLMTGPTELFVSILKTKASPGLRIGYRHLEAEDHNSSRLMGLYEGLRFTFAGYQPMDVLALDKPALIKAHFEELSDRMGFDILPPERLVNKIGYALLDAHENDKAVECFKLNVSNNPASPYAYSHLADAYLAKGKRELAIQNYQKALALDPTLASAANALAKLK